MTELRTKAKAAIRLNKPLIIGLSLCAALVILIALVQAFSPQTAVTRVKNNRDINPAQVNDNQLKSLPGSYQDRNLINNYLNSSEMSPAVQQALDQLKAQQQALSARLQKTSGLDGGMDKQLDQARTSGLFFPGTAPEANAMKSVMPGATNNNASPEKSAEGGAGGADSYALQNMQMQKLKFLMTSDKPEDIYNPHKVVRPVSPYLIQAGTLIPGSLITAVNSSLPGNIVAQVSQNVYDTVTGQHLLIPKGSRIIGQYDSQVAYGQERVLAAFTRIIRPDGSSILLDKMVGGDSQGTSGLTADVDNHWGKVLGAATITTMLSVGAGITADRSGGNNNYYQNTTQNALTGGAAGISQTGQQITGRAINVQPTLTVPAGATFDMVVNKDIIMDPYASDDDVSSTS